MSRSRSVIMIGGPDSGKTNYLGRLWGALTANDAALRSTQQPDDVRYVYDAYKCLLGGGFAPRTETNLDAEGPHCSIEVAWDRRGGTEHADLYVPDVSGELWKEAVRTNELADTWLSRVRQSVGALLFVRIDSDDHALALDWVTARQHLEVVGRAERADTPTDVPADIPTDVQLCEFLRFLELFLGKDANVPRTRVAVLVAAWDMLDEERAQKGPEAYLQHEFPLFAGSLAATPAHDVMICGLSVVGGDLREKAFKRQFLAGNPNARGYVEMVCGAGPNRRDVTVPVRWVLDGTMSA